MRPAEHSMANPVFHCRGVKPSWTPDLQRGAVEDQLLSGLLLQERLTVAPAILDLESHERLVALHASRSRRKRTPTSDSALSPDRSPALFAVWRRSSGMSRQPRLDLYVLSWTSTWRVLGHCDYLLTVRISQCGIFVICRLDTANHLMGAMDGGSGAGTAEELASHKRRLEDLGRMWALAPQGISAAIPPVRGG